MKRILLLFLFLSGMIAFAQPKVVATYHSIAKNKDFDIVGFTNGKSFSTMSIDVGKGTRYDISLWVEKPVKFKTALEQVAAKYAEWSKVAEEKNVTELEKEIPVDLPKLSIAWSNGFSSKISYDENWKFKFIVDGECRMLYLGGVGSAYGSPNLKETFTWLFKNVDEFNDFVGLLDYDRFSEILGCKPPKNREVKTTSGGRNDWFY